MSIAINQLELSQTVKLLQKIIPKKNSNPLLSSIVLQTNQDKQHLSLQVNDLNWGLKITLLAQVDQTNDYLLPGQTFIDATSIGDASDTAITFNDEGQITIQNGPDQVLTKSLNIDDYPFPLVQKEPQGIQITLKTSLIKEIKEKVVFATSSDLTRPQLTGVYFNFKPENLEIVGTDGFRLSVLTKKNPLPADALADSNSSSFSFLLPALVMSSLESVLDKYDSKTFDLFFDQAQDKIIFIGENFTFWVNLIKVAFPPYEKIIPPDFKSEITLDREDFLKTLQKAQLFAKEAANTAQFTFIDNKLLVKTQGESGFYNSEISLTSTIDEELKIAFNIKYLTDFLGTLNSPTVWLGLNDTVKPVMMAEKAKSDFRYIAMPFKART